MNAFHPFRESLRARGRAGLSLLSCASLCVLLMLSTSAAAVAQTYVFDGTLNSYTGTSNPNLSGTATTSDLDLGLGTPGANDTRVLRPFGALAFGGSAPESIGGFAAEFDVTTAPGQFLVSIALRGVDNPDVVRFNANVASAKRAHGVIVWPTSTDVAFEDLQLTLDTRVTLGGGGRFHKVVRAGGQYYVSTESFSETNGHWPLAPATETTWQPWDFTANGGDNFAVEFTAPVAPTGDLVDAIGALFVGTSNSAIVHDVSRMGWASSAVAGVELAPEAFFLLPGNSRVLTATVLPETARNQAITWTSSDEDVVTVDADGVVTAVGVGIATITVTTDQGGFTATAEATVTVPTVTGVSISPSVLPLQKSQTGQLTAEVLPESSINRNITWTSSDESVATVDHNGWVTAVDIGSATITVTTEEGAFTAQATVNVSEAAVTGVEIEPGTRQLMVGQEAPFTVTVLPEAAANKNVSWTSLDPDVATVDEHGRVLGLTEGTVAIRVTSEDGSLTDEAAVTVIPLPDPGPATGRPRIAATNLHWVRDWLPPILADVIQNTAGIRIWAQLSTEDRFQLTRTAGPRPTRGSGSGTISRTPGWARTR